MVFGQIQGGPFQDDDGSELDEDTVSQLHFGGGSAPEGSERGKPFKTKKEVHGP
jgi:hypothetical protein